MKLSQYAKFEGIHYTTAFKYFHEGTLPYPSRQMANGTIFVDVPPERYRVKEPADTKTEIVVYGRVSSHGQKLDLERQVGRICTWALANNLSPTRTVTDIGSGLNGRRKGLINILKNPNLKAIIVEHKDRLARWGWDFIEASLEARGVKLYVVDPTETVNDITQDLIDVTTSVCARLYGKRSARNKAQVLTQSIRKDAKDIP